MADMQPVHELPTVRIMKSIVKYTTIALLISAIAFTVAFLVLQDMQKLLTALLAILTLAFFEYPLPVVIIALKRKDITMQSLAMSVAWIVKMALVFGIMLLVVNLNIVDNLLYATVLVAGAVVFIILDIIIFTRHSKK
jgi:hypothetical protein